MLIRLLFPVTRIVIPVIAIMTAIVIMEEGPIAVVIIPVADVEPDEGNRPLHVDAPAIIDASNE